MASLGHVGVGVAAARLYAGERPGWPSMAAWSALALLPDADVIGFSLGVRYEDPWGHRGATHSFAFAIAVGAAVGLVAARLFKRPVARTIAFAGATLVSHPLLDTLTDGGLGCALFWPFDLTRYFAPWRPIQVAPIGLAFFSPYGVLVALSELVLFLPCFVFALRTRTSDFKLQTWAALLLIWSVLAWLVASTDAVREATVAWLLRDHTEFASGFSEAKFANLTEGQSHADVRRALGEPLEDGWLYPPAGKDPKNTRADTRLCSAVRFKNDLVFETFGAAACESLGIRRGLTRSDVERLLGTPSDSCWEYSKGPPKRPFRLRLVCFHGDNVEMIARRWVF